MLERPEGNGKGTQSQKEEKSEQLGKKINRLVSYFVFITLIGSSIFLIVRIILSPSSDLAGLPETRTKSEYFFMLAQCLLGLAAMLLPGLISKKFRVTIPSFMYLLYVLFLYCATYLGEVHNFFYKVPHWDSILHCFSGVMLGALGYSVIALLNRSKRATVQLSPFFLALFAFCFAVTMGVFWEIYEFLTDGLLHSNMQKFALQNGVPLVGREALKDTMYDFIVDSLGAFLMSAIGYISMKYNKGWLEKLMITKKRGRKQQENPLSSENETGKKK